MGVAADIGHDMACTAATGLEPPLQPIRHAVRIVLDAGTERALEIAHLHQMHAPELA
ncbi:hypothetical protein D3C87_2130570 [compost metagenome]